VVAIIAAVLSVIGGVITGIAASKYTGIGTDEFGDQVTQTRHHGDVVVFWIAVGVLTAALWMAVAVDLRLIADIGESLRAIARAPGTSSTA
jgi:hypothetical protein